MKTIAGLKYTENHEWVLLEGDIAIIGISDYAQEALGEVVYVDLPIVGDQVTRDDVFASVESVKAASDVYSPVSGEIVQISETLEDEPERLNEEPYDAFLMKVKCADVEELNDLMDEEAYQDFCDNL